MNVIRVVLLAFLCAGLGACATTPSPLAANAHAVVSVDQTTANPLAIYDPWDGFNRRMYHFNDWLDDHFLLPVVHTYQAVAPVPVRHGISNFFSNLGEITTFANAVLQFKPETAAVTLGRFVINTTFGVGGLLDMASGLGLEQRHEDFGQTLGRYGVGAGPYLVLPFLGPSTLRDSLGFGVDRLGMYALDPLSLQEHRAARTAYLGLYAINKRSTNGFRYYQTGSPFEYLLVRFVYVNFRKLQIAQ